jgi:hypothetical protein
MFRIRRLVFLDLHDTSVQYYGSRGMCKYTKEALPMFLWVCGAPQLFRNLKNKFSHSLETVNRKVKEVFESVMGLVFEIVKPKDPHFGTIHPKLQEARFWPHFKYCISAVHDTHIPLMFPLSEQPKYMVIMANTLLRYKE